MLKYFLNGKTKCRIRRKKMIERTTKIGELLEKAPEKQRFC